MLISIASCTNEPAPLAEIAPGSLNAANEIERNRLMADLTQLSDDIEREIEKLRRQYPSIEKQDRDAWNTADRKLKSNRSKVEKAFRDLHESTDGNWESVKMSTTQTTRDIKSSLQTLAYHLENLFAGE